MIKEDFEKLKIYVETEFKLTESNVLQKSLQISNLLYELTSIYSKESKLLKIQQIEKDKFYGELYRYYRYGEMKGRPNFQQSLSTKSEIDPYIESDELYYKIALEVAGQEVIVNYLEQIVKSINSLGYNIKNYIDLQKFNKGIM
jgi:hypothetical protein